MKRLTGRDKRRERRGVGGRLYLEPKFPIGFFQDRHCLDVGCGSGRWTRALLALGASVKSIDASENSLRSTRRYNPNVERLDLFKIGGTRPDLHEAFDFTLCWGVIMCTHDPKLAFENVACTVKSGGFLYVMVYAPTYHASDFVLEARKHYHRRLLTAEERLDYVNELARHDSNNAINYMDMLNTYYNWTIDEGTLVQWCANNGFDYPSFLNAHEPHKCAHHAVARRR
jgi:SAM-dependent methyltransferase